MAMSVTSWVNELFTTELVLTIAIVLLPLLISISVLTIGMSIYAYRADRRRAAFESAVRSEMLLRLGLDEPQWGEWVADLGDGQREVAIAQLEEYLNLLEGEDRDRLIELADHLGLESLARSGVESNSQDERCQGIHRLALLGAEVDHDWLLEHLTEARVEREAAVSLLVLEDRREARRRGVELLLAGDELTGYGVEMFYRLLEDDPVPAFDQLSEAELTNPDLLSQVLLVLSQLQMTDEAVPLDPIVAYLSHDHEVVRERACLVLGTYGWREGLREQVEVKRLLDDPSPRVRSATYRMLSEWGDEQAVATLAEAVETESHERARIFLIQAFDAAGHDGEDIDDVAVYEHERTWASVPGVVKYRRDALV